MKRIGLLATLLLIALIANAQVVTGRVVSTARQPLDRAAVYLKDGNNTVAFGFSHAHGHFAVDTKGKAYSQIEVRRFNYETVALPKAEFRDGQDIVLNVRKNELREVVVKAQKVRQEGDTLNYLVSAFKNKQDRTLADVLRKMPGISVNEDGSIMYQGKRINKFYIEGMDLLGAKYAQASENLAVGKVRNVQVLERHQPIKALKGKSFSEQAALNIVLSDSAKNVWTPTVDLATGVANGKPCEWLYDNRLTSMFFSRKMQSITMYKNNNTGKNIGQEVSPMAAYLDDAAPTDGGMLSNILLPAPDIDAQRSRLNQTHLLATNWLFKTRGNNDLRVQLDAMADQSAQRRQTSTLYTMADRATIVEEVSAQAHRNVVNAQVLYKQNTERQYLTNDLRAYIDFDCSEGMARLNGVNTQQYVEPRQRYLSDKLSFIRNLNAKHTLSANAYASLNYAPEQLLLFNETTERLERRSLLAGVNTHWGHKLGAFRLNYALGTDGKAQQLNIAYGAIDAKRNYNEWRTYLRPTLSYKSARLTMTASTPLYWTARAYEDQRQSKVTIEPQLYLSTTLSPAISLTTLYNYTWRPNGFAAMIDLPVFTDYITLQKAYGRLDHTMAHFGRASAEYKDVMKGFFAHASYSFTNMRHQRLYAQRIADNHYQSLATDLTTSSTTHSVEGRMSESWDFAHLLTTLSGAYHWNNYKMLVAQRITPFQTQSANVSLSLSLQPTTWFSLEEKSSYHYIHQYSTATVDRHTASLRSFSHQLKCFLMPGSFQVEWNNEVYHSNDRSVSFTYFADLSLSYRRKRYEIALTCHNLLGKSEYLRQQITDTQQIYTITRLRGRDIIVRVILLL